MYPKDQFSAENQSAQLQRSQEGRREVCALWHFVRTFHGWSEAIVAVAVAVGLALSGSLAVAQSGAGSIQGTVSDSTGAVIPNASIHVVNKATGVTADTKSNNVGFYQVPSLFTATYEATVSAPGFKTYAVTLNLLVDQHAVVNVELVPGEVTQRVEVAADLVQLTTTDTGTVTSTLDNSRISQIPMNTRQIVSLVQKVTPGLENTQSDGTRANGLMMEHLEYVADGVPLVNRNFGGPNASVQGQFPDADSVQEVRVDINDTSAAYATPGTAIITTKSGTNNLHGSLFETAINSYWGTAKNRSQASNYHALPYVRNEFGASAGGPIILPHLYHGKDKSFWFFAYERYSLASTSQESVAVPDAAMEKGDFSELSAIGNPVQLYNPATTAANAACPTPKTVNGVTTWNGGTPINNPYCRTPYGSGISGDPANNQIPAGLLSPSAKLLYSITPSPNNTNNPFGGVGNVSAPNVSYVTVPTITFRLDHNFSEADKAYLRYTSNWQYNRALRNYPSNQPATIAANGFPDGASGYQIIPVTTFAAAAGYTHVFSPTFFSETVISQQWFRQYVGGGGNPNLNYDKMLGMPNNFGETGFPVISGMHTMQYGGTMYQYQENQILSTIDENLTKTIGKQQLLFGGRYRHERLYYLNSRQADTAAFGNNTTGLYDPTTGAVNQGSAHSSTGYSDADFFLGSAGSYSVQLEPPPSWFRDMEFDAYLQDNYHASKNLTIYAGLRYEAHPALQVRGGVMDAFDLTNHALVMATPISQLIQQGWTTQAIITNMQNIGVKFEQASDAGYPGGLVDNANLTVGPRLGLAWLPFGNRWGTVLRGAYGRYIAPTPTRSYNPGPQNLPFAYGYTQNFNTAGQSPDGNPNYLLRYPQSITMGVNASNVVNSSTLTAITPGFGFSVITPDYKPEMATEVNATLEQPLKGNSALRFTWVWTHGSYLDRIYHPNSHPSTFVWESQTGIDPPNGGASVIGTPQQNTYSATATGPYDNTVYGDFGWGEKNGWSNDNSFEANYERLFHNGFGYQIFYVWSRAFRVGDNSSRDSVAYTYRNYYGVNVSPNVTVTSAYPYVMPATPPLPPSGVASYADYHALDAWANYKVDSGIPPQHIQFNYIYDLPIGRGKRFLGNANRFVNELVGGYQIAGDGSILNSTFQPAASMWGPISPIKYYKNWKITDCRSGNCYQEYLWFNGYISPKSIQGPNCSSKCVSGLPPDYVPYQTYIVSDPTNANFGTNNVTVASTVPSFNNGKGPETQGFGTGGANGQPLAKTFLYGPWNWNSDASLYKVFPITERFNLRFNMDVFNVLNHQGTSGANTTDGTIKYLAGGAPGASSFNTPRQMQFTLRLSF